MKRKILTAVATVVVLSSTPAFAFLGLPSLVFDPSNYAKNVITAVKMAEQVNQMALQYQRQYQQLQRAAEQVSAMTGARGMGLLLNSATHIDDRRYTPETWEDTLRILTYGGSPASASDVRNIYNSMRIKYQIANRSVIDPLDADSPQAFGHEQTMMTTFSNAAIAEKAFNLTSKRRNNYETLLAQIETAPDAKASQDLANRIAIANGLAINDLNKLLATQMQLSAAQSNQALIERTNAAKLNKFTPTVVTTTP